MSSVPEMDYNAQVNDWKQRMPATSWAEQFQSLKLHLAGSLVLDCGCGPGKYGALLTQMGCRLIGLDREPRCLMEASQVHRGYAGLTRGFVGALPFRDQVFDIVLLRYVLHHIPDAERGDTLREIRRVAKPGRYLVIETAFEDQFALHHDHRIYPQLTHKVRLIYPDRKRLGSLLQQAGFDNVRLIETVQTWPPYASVSDALEKSRRLVERGEGPTAWLRLTDKERREFHAARLIELPALFKDGVVPRIWHGHFVVAKVS